MPKNNEESSSLGGFRKLSVIYSETSNVEHLLYVKEHNVRDANNSKPAGKTLFVVNVPLYCTEDNFKVLFEPCGLVTKVYFHDKPTSALPQEPNIFSAIKDSSLCGFKVAYVVFKKAGGLKNALKLAENETVLKIPASSLNCGIKKWSQEYNSSFIDIEKIQKEVDDYLEGYDQKAQEEINKAKELDGVPDDDGWITVTRHGKKQVASRTEANKRKVEEKEKKKRSKKELMNFYTFQIRESKMEHVAQLRKKFEEDKKRIALLKSARKFKPY